jgi:hypothetical protein
MLKPTAGVLLGFLIALPLAAAPPATSAQPTTSAKPTEQEMTPTEFRDSLQQIETDIISKAVSFTSDEAAKFWPVFQKFQAEEKSIIDDQLAALKKYSDDYASLTDEQSVAYVNSLLDRDQRVHDLRAKYLAEFSKIMPPGKAARVIHLSRRIVMATQVRLSSEIPLVH